MTCASAHAFARALASSLCPLAYLNLSHNRIHDEGISDLSAAVLWNTTLVTLDISRNLASDAAVKAAREAMDPRARQLRVALRTFRAAALIVLLAHRAGDGQGAPVPVAESDGTDEVEVVQPVPVVSPTGFASLPTTVLMLVLAWASPDGFDFGHAVGHCVQASSSP